MAAASPSHSRQRWGACRRLSLAGRPDSWHVQAEPRHGHGSLGAAVEGEQASQPFLCTRFTEVGPAFSPDGRWIAYVSDESGQYEVYVRPYPARRRKVAGFDRRR